MSDFEITVKVDLSLNELLEYLNRNQFFFHQSFRCIDFYLIKKEALEDKLTYQDLNKCIIFRKLIFKDKVLRYIVKKEKQYDDKGNIIESKQENITTENLLKVKEDYLNNGYVELIRMDDYCYTYSKNRHEFIVEHINEIGTFIEFENKNYYSNEINGVSIEELISLFDTFKISYDRNNYFFKKAWLLIQKLHPEYVK